MEIWKRSGAKPVYAIKIIKRHWEYSVKVKEKIMKRDMEYKKFKWKGN